MSRRDSRVYPLYGRDDGEVRRRIADRLRKVPEGKSVLFLGRYNHDVRILDSDGFSWRPNLSGSSQVIGFSDRPDLEMRFMTTHSSKGLQADVVFSLNNRTGRYRFPSKRDEPVLILLLLGKGGDQYDEERRLFYVGWSEDNRSCFHGCRSDIIRGLKMLMGDPSSWGIIERDGIARCT